MIVELTNADIALLKKEKRLGYAYSLIVIGFGIIPSVLYLISLEYIFLLIDAIMLILIYLVCFLINRKLNRDLKKNAKNVIERSIENKIVEDAFEAGSASVNFSVWLVFIPSTWRMRESKRYVFLINGIRYEVSKSVFDSYDIGEPVFIHFAACSYTLLGFSKVCA